MENQGIKIEDFIRLKIEVEHLQKANENLQKNIEKNHQQFTEFKEEKVFSSIRKKFQLIPKNSFLITLIIAIGIIIGALKFGYEYYINSARGVFENWGEEIGLKEIRERTAEINKYAQESEMLLSEIDNCHLENFEFSRSCKRRNKSNKKQRVDSNWK